MESLENVSVDRKTEELKAQLRNEEMKWELELRKWDHPPPLSHCAAELSG